MPSSSASGASAGTVTASTPAVAGGDVFAALWAQLKANVKTDLAGPIIAAANSIIATPDTQEAVLQGPQLLTAVVAVGPHLEAQEFVSLATAIKTWAATLPTAS